MQLYIYISLAKACDENPESPGSLAVTSLSSPLRFSGASSPAWGLTCSRSPQGSHQSTWHSSGTRLPAGMCCKTRTLLDHRNPRSQWALVLIASTRLPVHVCVCAPSTQVILQETCNQKFRDRGWIVDPTILSNSRWVPLKNTERYALLQLQAPVSERCSFET